MPIIIDARNMGSGSIGSATGGDTSNGTRNNVALVAPWDESKEYLKGDLVTDNGDLYQAQKGVPAGIKITDEDYWYLVVAGGNANEMEKFREDVGSLDDLETESKDNLVAAINEVCADVMPQKTTKKCGEDETVTLADNAEYRLTNVTTLAFAYPEDDFECWIRLTIAESGDVAVTLPEGTKYIGSAPTFANGEVWELSIKDGVVVTWKVGDGT